MYGKDTPEPKSVGCTKWFKNPLTLGAFHCIRNGVTSENLENLSRDIGNMFFAGTLQFFYKQPL